MLEKDLITNQEKDKQDFLEFRQLFFQMNRWQQFYIISLAKYYIFCDNVKKFLKYLLNGGK